MAVIAKQRIRSAELTLDEVAAKYPEVPRLIILKTDVQRRGVHYTEQALRVVDESIHQLRSPNLFGSRDGAIKPLPESLLLRDGTSIVVDPAPLEANPYHLDLVDGQLALIDAGEVLEFVELWPKPRYYDQRTSAGTPMKHVITARPQRLNLFLSGNCEFWKDQGACRFCDIVRYNQQQRQQWGIPSRLEPRDIAETISEALKEEGRFSGICLTSGSVLQGGELFDREVDYYIEALQAIGENFAAKKFPSELIASAFNERQLARLYEQTGLMAYTSDLEVLNEEQFNRICPGKARGVGYQEWRRRLVRAVDIFGRGNVGTGLVGGVELSKPNGFTREADALRSTLDEAEYLAENGVTTFFIVWVPRPGSALGDQNNPSLEYYVQLALGLHRLRVKYGLTADFNDYRRCGNHPDTDLARLI